MSDLFEAAFEHAGVGKALVSPQGRFIRANAAFQEILGLSEAEMLAVDFQTITHPEDLDSDLALLTRLAAGEITSYCLHKRYIHKSGSVVTVMLTVSAVREADGSVRCFVSEVQDHTARVDAERAVARTEARFRLMAENTSDMIVTTGGEGQILFVTPACRRITGHEPHDLVGRRAVDFAHPEDLSGLLRGFSALMRGEPSARLRWRARHKSEDRWVWLESSPALLPPGDETGAVFVDVIRDVTDAVVQEAALADARRQADMAIAAKSEFLANMSHEIRTPLTAVVGFADLLSEQPLDTASQGYVKRIETAGRALLALVNDILDYSRMEAGHLEIAPRATPTFEVLDEVTAILGPAAEAKGIELKATCAPGAPEMVQIDADRLRQVILNLGSNAIKFTEAGGVYIDMAWREEDASLAVTVRDTGVGLTADQRDRLFKRFSQVGPRSKSRHGTGLGLAICRTLVEAMAGRIEVTSRPGEGSTFSFAIPAPATDPEIDLGGDFLAGGLAGLRVMVVDDNESNRRLARAVLESQGAEIAEAADGVAAVDLARRSPCDVIVMDVRMPELDGPGALRRIRAEPGPNRHTPILAFTAGADDEALDGFDDIVPKPLLAGDLVRTVRKAVGGSFA